MNFLYINKYFNNKFSKGFFLLFGSKTILMIVSGFVGIFLPIFLFKLLGSDIKLVALYFGIGSLFYVFVVPLGALFLNKFGFRNALRMSVIWGALFYTILYFTKSENAIYLLLASIVVLTLYRVFYWLPYQIDFAKFTDNDNRGKQISLISIVRKITAGLVPILSGFLITKFGFGFVFIIAIILYLFSGLFYINLPRTKEKFDWNYRQSWAEFFKKKNEKVVLAFMANGAESIVGGVVWPIFIFELLKGDYLKVGYLSAIIVIVTIILQFFVGHRLDNGDSKEKVLKFGSFFYSLGWIIKIFVVTAFHIFIVGIYHNIMRIFTKTPFNVLTYDLAIDQGHYVDEFTVLHEMSVHTGKILAVIFIIFLSFFLPLQWTFLLAAASSISLNALKEKYNLEVLPLTGF